MEICENHTYKTGRGAAGCALKSLRSVSACPAQTKRLRKSLRETHWASLFIAESPRDTYLQSGHLLEILAQSLQVPQGGASHPLPSAHWGGTQAESLTAPSRFTMSPGGLFTCQDFNLEIRWVFGFFFLLFACRKCSNKTGKVSLDFGRTPKRKKKKEECCTASEPNFLAGIGPFIWVVKERGAQCWVFYYLRVRILPVRKFRISVSVVNAARHFSGMNIPFGFLFISRWYHRRVTAECQPRGRTARCTPTGTALCLVLASQAPLEPGTVWKGLNGEQQHTVSQRCFATESLLCSGETSGNSLVSTSSLSAQIWKLIKLSVRGGNCRCVLCGCQEVPESMEVGWEPGTQKRKPFYVIMEPLRNQFAP